MAEIKAFKEACEMQRLDIEDGEFWSKAYLPLERTIETPGAFEGKLILIKCKSRSSQRGNRC